MSDPRENLPSASGYSMDEACAGRQTLIKSLPLDKEAIEEPDEMATRGSRIHKAWETGVTFDLASDELEDLQETIKLAAEVASDWKTTLPENHGTIERFKEEREWLRHPDTLEPLLSGQYDELYICGDQGLVLDLKSGWCKTLTKADSNRQLRVLAVLVAKAHDLTHVQAAFIKPKVKRNQIDAVDFMREDLIQAEASIMHSLWLSQQPTAPRIPGDHCTYCIGKSFCPEAGAYSMLPSVMVNAIETKEMQAIVDRMAPADLAMVFSRSGIIVKILDAVKKRLKGMNAVELATLGLRVSNGRKLDPIVNSQGAFEALKGAGIEEEQLWKALSFGKGDLVTVVMQTQSWSKAEAEKWLFENKLVPFIEKKKSEGWIEKA